MEELSLCMFYVYTCMYIMLILIIHDSYGL